MELLQLLTLVIISVTFVGISTITGIGTGNIITDKLNVTGISTLQNDVLIGSGVTLSPDGDGFFTGVVTATSYGGDGSALTGMAHR